MSNHCVKGVRIRSYSGPYFPAFGLNTERYSVSFRIHSECAKIRTRITPNTDTFYAVDISHVEGIGEVPIIVSTVFLLTISLKSFSTFSKIVGYSSYPYVWLPSPRFIKPRRWDDIIKILSWDLKTKMVNIVSDSWYKIRIYIDKYKMENTVIKKHVFKYGNML